MRRKFYTFVIFPGAHGALRKVRVPYYVIHVTLAFSIVGLVTVAGLARSYARMVLKVSNYDMLSIEREALKEQNRTLRDVVKTTDTQLGSLRSLAAEVALTYGFGRTHALRFPQAAIALVTQTNSTVESSYQASLYAFNLLQNWSLQPGGNAVAQGLIPVADLERRSIPSLWPVRGRVTAGFGQRLDPFSGEGAFHSGIDLAAPSGTAVVASADGLVVSAGLNLGGYGNEVVIDHGSGYTTEYGHLSKIYVLAGQEVKRGQTIGAIGMTGKATGPHLHYEVMVNETRVNPAEYLRE